LRGSQGSDVGLEAPEDIAGEARGEFRETEFGIFPEVFLGDGQVGYSEFVVLDIYMFLPEKEWGVMNYM